MNSARSGSPLSSSQSANTSRGVSSSGCSMMSFRNAARVVILLLQLRRRGDRAWLGRQVDVGAQGAFQALGPLQLLHGQVVDLPAVLGLDVEADRRTYLPQPPLPKREGGSRKARGRLTLRVVLSCSPFPP